MNDRKQHKQLAIFLDRDGTVIEEGDYLSNPDRIRLLPGVGEAIRALNRCGWLAIVVSNQSGIGRGYFDEEALAHVQERLSDLLAAEEARLDDFFYCPHAPEDNCSCRKPEPGLLLTASSKYGISLKDSWILGDKASDVETGRRAGCKACLVLTGYGEQEAKKSVQPDLMAPDLLSAVRQILGIEGDIEV